MKLSGTEALADLISTFPPSSIRVLQTDSVDFYRWEFSFPSGLRETVVLSASQSLTMANAVVSTSGTRTSVQIGSQEQLKLSPVSDSAQPPTEVP